MSDVLHCNNNSQRATSLSLTSTILK